MPDSAITDYSAKITVNGEELIEVVDLREALAANQNKKMTLENLFGSLVIHENEMTLYENAVVYM